MQLFDFTPEPEENILPEDGIVHYYRALIHPDDAYRYFRKLLEKIAWRNDELLMFGKRITTKRKVAWYGDNPFDYTYSKTTKKALPWINELIELKKKAELATGETYNSCLLNLYHSGEEGMSWHSDNEPELKREGAIASISLGTERKFVFRHQHSGNKVEQLLENGSLLLMKGSTQDYWQHALPPSKKADGARINLTFRTIVG
ncbi:alpha-ketoglutarate-dependent dioxygenase AlkB [Roseivirga sp. UBA838]|uniref:alpha-ketoglutarate-dependent dioxygenase AlkB family protein n=1 Tax=Roseivirga sp. UBA838 TaxID=1947393 RepID=UPI00257E5940|nr:alpha-ketoglutarate-dependent dioxygenase AlkB [Roseivirga sp. UBA838]|tara:strand:+ start:30511 stop:31119 length:609 start_codon:yes stop_codon:yes gene_type:complete